MIAAKRIVRRKTPAQAGENLPPELHPLLRRVFLNRGLTSASQLDHGLGNLLPPWRLAGMDAAVETLCRCIDAGRRILILGDFDADGATATALAVLGLRRLLPGRIDYLVPNRFEYGYGLTPEIAAVAAARRPGLVITVDNGITSVAGVRILKAHGIKVIITDHHLAGERLPEADAIVNPNQPGCDFPSKALAGVGVMFYLLLGLRTRLRRKNWFAAHGLEEPSLAAYLDLVALGTVADLVPLDHNNRILVAQGLARIRAGVCRPGIVSLLEVAGRHYERAVTSDLGFVVGPRLNAAGRLDDMSSGIECLLAEDGDSAGALAATLHDINQRRREIEQQMHQQAAAALDSLEMLEDPRLAVGACLFDKRWHQGVTGLVASRLKDRLTRPVIAFAPGDNGILKGSARSIPQLHIRDALAAIAARNPGLIQQFGGHAMAAGLTIALADLDSFREEFLQEMETRLCAEELESTLFTDGCIDAVEHTVELAEILRDAAPWGQGFPAPLFDGCFEVLSQRVVGGQHLKLTLRPEDGGKLLDGIAFRFCTASNPELEFRRVQVVYQLEANEFRGRRSAQLLIEHLEPLAEEGEPRQ